MLCARCLHTYSAREAEEIFHACSVKWSEATGRKEDHDHDDGIWGGGGGDGDYGFSMQRARMLLLKRRHEELANYSVTALRKAFLGSWDLIKGRQIMAVVANVACHALPIELRSEVSASGAGRYGGREVRREGDTEVQREGWRYGGREIEDEQEH